MTDYTELELPQLLDLLVKHIKEYTTLLSTHTYTVKEVSNCKETLKKIHEAIKLKHKV